MVEFDVTTFPAIEGCPECGSTHLSAVTLTHEEADLGLDGENGIRRFNPGSLYETYYIELACFDCETTLVEDGQRVHDELPEEDT